MGRLIEFIRLQIWKMRGGRERLRRLEEWYEREYLVKVEKVDVRVDPVTCAGIYFVRDQTFPYIKKSNGDVMAVCTRAIKGLK